MYCIYFKFELSHECGFIIEIKVKSECGLNIFQSGSSTVTTESHSNSGPDSTLGTSTFSSTASTFNVMQMIQSIRNQAQTDKSVSLPTSQSSSAAGSAVTPSNTAVSGCVCLFSKCDALLFDSREYVPYGVLRFIKRSYD